MEFDKFGAYPPGHYYSPIPSQDDINLHIATIGQALTELKGIKIDDNNHLELLQDYSDFYKDLPFEDEKKEGLRYYYNNSWFSYSDAIFLHCFLRANHPKRIIEIGSGYSSSVMLDTFDLFYSEKPELTFIEPYPERLLSLLQDSDKEYVKIVKKKVQDLDIEMFKKLQAGDFLFIDSSHVAKIGSDILFIFFEILPQLKPGVFVHFHDIFYPFDYPTQWVENGIFWNECYMLRAFLSFNSQWSIHFFNTYAHHKFGDVIAKKMSLCRKNYGGSIYIRRDF